jgi:hypothetical protein
MAKMPKKIWAAETEVWWRVESEAPSNAVCYFRNDIGHGRVRRSVVDDKVIELEARAKALEAEVSRLRTLARHATKKWKSFVDDQLEGTSHYADEIGMIEIISQRIEVSI